jgi:type II secretory pathway pseudopilin PulG
MAKRRAHAKGGKGFTIIETIVGIAIFAVIFLSLLNLFGAVLRSVRNNKAVLSANSLAMEQMEIIRGMDFNNIRTDTGWVPAGPIPSTRSVVRGGITYTVNTDISWVDDAFDGSDPDDTFPFDYKRVRVRVSWNSPAGGAVGRIDMNTNVVPEGIEGMSAGRGGLYLTVFNANAQPVAAADITIQSASTGYSLTPAAGGRTDLNGNIWIPELLPGDDYHISVTKAGYSTAETYAVNNDPASPAYNPFPSKVHAKVIAQKAVKIGFQIDLLGRMNIVTMHFDNPSNFQVNAATPAEQTESALVLDGSGNLFVAWADNRDTEKNIYLQKLNADGSGGWPSDQLIVDQPNASTPRLQVLPDGSLYGVWSDDRSGGSLVYLQQFSTANGNPVGSAYAVGHAPAGTIGRNPDVGCDQDGNLYVIWEDNRGGTWDVFAQKFVPAGAAFWGSDLRLNSVETGDQIKARLVLDRDTDAGGGNANNLYAVWQGNQNGNYDIFLRKFDRAGAPAFVERTINTDGGALDQYEPVLAYDGSNYLYLAWSDERDSQPDIFLQKADKGGMVQLATDVRINDDSYPTARRTRPSLAYASDTDIYVAWEDDRNGNTVSSVYASKIDASANRLWTYDLILADTINSQQTNVATVRGTGTGAISVWQDTRSGSSDIRGVAYSEMGNMVRVGVPIIVTSDRAKGTYGEPPVNIPKYQRTFTSDGGGNIHIDAAAGGLEWGGYTFSVPSPYTIISVDLPSPINVNPGATASAIINVGP